MRLIELVKSGDCAAIKSNIWTVRELNEQDKNGLTAMMHAASCGDYHTIAALKDAGADLDIRDNSGMKAVHHAAKNGHSIAIIYLIEGGCGG